MFSLLPPLPTSGYLTDWTKTAQGVFTVSLGKKGRAQSVELGTTVNAVVLGLAGYFENDNPSENAPKVKVQALLLIPSLAKNEKTRGLLDDWAGPVVRAFVPADWARDITQDSKGQRVGHQELLSFEKNGLLAVQIKLVRSGKFTNWELVETALPAEELKRAATFQAGHQGAIWGWVEANAKPYQGSGGNFGKPKGRRSQDDEYNGYQGQETDGGGAW